MGKNFFINARQDSKYDAKSDLKSNYQQAFTCSKSTMETLEKGVNDVQSEQ